MLHAIYPVPETGGFQFRMHQTFLHATVFCQQVVRRLAKGKGKPRSVATNCEGCGISRLPSTVTQKKWDISIDFH